MPRMILTLENLIFFLFFLSRLPGIFRGAAVACDSKGRNFAVLQILPNASMYEIPEVESSDMVKDLEQFRAETNNMDLLHDVVFKVRLKNI